MNNIFKTKEKQVQKVVMLPLGNIVPNKSQPRKYFDEAAIYSLSQSIKENGIIQPICVRKSGALYEIISGERRCRASKLAGLSEVPCIIMEINDEKSAVLALIENIQRSDLSFFEEALAINELISVYGLTQQEAAIRLGKAQSTIANKLRLLRFTDAERNILACNNIPERQARALIRIDDPSQRIKMLNEVIRRKLNLDQTERLVNDLLTEKKSDKKIVRANIFNIPLPKIYLNSINKIVDRMKSENIRCETVTNQNGNFFEYTIKIPVTVDMCK
ncbi:MAG: ParB/RepB/Spo0J family partition protein [Oscillospiraceae bacterium]|nr:ParB/RepB/Spo0J family partition protein [Oscillospiraceae bacterium]